eukprot:scaffold1849_cov107-Isochrysis_galbana.AAC.10
MGKEKLPVLRTLLRPEEAAHIEAFPSVLRLIVGTPFLDHLAAASVDALCGIQSLRLHRVIDNGEMWLNGDQMWTHLNYQLIHLLDFLPPTSWQATFNEFLPQHFAVLHRLLLRVGKLEVVLSHRAFPPPRRPVSSSTPDGPSRCCPARARPAAARGWWTGCRPAWASKCPGPGSSGTRRPAGTRSSIPSDGEEVNGAASGGGALRASRHSAARGQLRRARLRRDGPYTQVVWNDTTAQFTFIGW